MPDESKRRVGFPDYVPMFPFPDDVHIISSDQRPRSTWHGFAMTAVDNSRIHGVCVIIWIPLQQQAAEALEERCEEWRRDNMTDEERELAASLGERLAQERAKLSRLLAQLPSVPSGSDERDDLEEEISGVEEKITLMADLLRPVRHGAASRIEGLTDGESGFWIPRAYGIIGADAGMTSFWREWLRAVVTPMMDGAILRVPPSSPKIGLWQPLERYVVNLCTEAPSPISSKTQVEVAVRELRLFARREAINELPGSRNTDLYALFRCLSIPTIVILFEYVLCESRIILLSSHTAMLELACKAIIDLLYPLTWAGILIPVLPSRLVEAVEAPCPYIVGVQRQYEKLELPDDDFVLVDLDQDSVESTSPPVSLPRQQRRKLTTLLQQAAPHWYRYGVKTGPPPYAKETFPFDSYSSGNGAIFSPTAPTTGLAKYVGLNSASYGDASSGFAHRPLVFNAFLTGRKHDRKQSVERPSTASTMKTSRPESPRTSPVSTSFPPLPTTPVSRNDSGFALQSSLREKRSGYFETSSRRGSTFGLERNNTVRRPSATLGGHSSSMSMSTILDGVNQTPNYAPSVYAQSTLAASTIMPSMLHQPVRNDQTTTWVEGHCLEYRFRDSISTCSVCDEKAEDGIFKCVNCNTYAHNRCTHAVTLVCPAAFHPEQIRAAFVRCFASLFYTYRKFMTPANGKQKQSGLIYKFNMEGFMKSMPHENADYLAMLQQTQGTLSFPSCIKALQDAPTHLTFSLQPVHL